MCVVFFFFKQKTAYEMRISDWSSDVCSSDLYVDHGGAMESSRQLGVDPHQVAKTLIMEDEAGQPLIVLMHGDYEVSTKNLARQTGAKKIAQIGRASWRERVCQYV